MVPLALSYFEIASLSGRTRAAAIVVTSPSHANHSSRRLTLGRKAALMATFEIIKAGCSWETLALSRAFQTRSWDLWPGTNSSLLQTSFVLGRRLIRFCSSTRARINWGLFCEIDGLAELFLSWLIGTRVRLAGSDGTNGAHLKTKKEGCEKSFDGTFSRLFQ